jgi:hypothetical protein
MKTRTRAVAALALTCILGVLSTAVPANAAVSDVKISDGTLIAKGAAVQLSYTYRCDLGQTVVGRSVTISQKISQGRIAQAWASESDYVYGFPCTGEDQTVPTTATSGYLALKTGPALATVQLQVCDATYGYPTYPCEYPVVSQEIRLGK